MDDTLYDRRRYRLRNVLDQGNRQALAFANASSLPGAPVVPLLDQLIALHGTPAMPRSDDGPAFIATAFWI